MRLLTITRDILIHADDVVGNGKPFHNIFDLRPEERTIAVYGGQEVPLPLDAQLVGVRLKGMFSGEDHMSTRGINIFDIKIGVTHSQTAACGFFAAELIAGKEFRFMTPTHSEKGITVLFSNERDVDWIGQVVFTFADKHDVEGRTVDEICPFVLPRTPGYLDIDGEFTVQPKSRKSIIACPQVGGSLEEIYVDPRVMAAIGREQLAVSAMLYALGEEGHESRHRPVKLNHTVCTDRIVILDRPSIASGEVFELRIRNSDFAERVGPRQFLLHFKLAV